MYNVIRDDHESGLISNVVDGVIIALIIVNVVMAIADTFTISDRVKTVFYYVELVSVIIFSIEYALRLWTADLRFADYRPFRARVRYLFSFMALIDLLAILPFYIPLIMPIDLRVLRTLRIIRLFRLLKVNRYTKALSSISSVFIKKKHQLLSAVMVVILLMIIASVLMYNVENGAQPDKFNNAFSALWWAVATLTTVGYGDIYPVTVLGKILSEIIALLGIGLVAVPTGIISAGFIEQMEQNRADLQSHDKKCFCPYCGHKLDE